jgi:hypothetical protein
MPDDPLTRALEQAERSQPEVRAAARMRIARVQSVSDPEQARRTFQTALDEVRKFPGREREFFLEEAQLFAAAIAPDLVSEIRLPNLKHQHSHSQSLGKIMLEHGHLDAGFEFLTRYRESSPLLPFSIATVTYRIQDEDRRLAILRRALERWRAAPHPNSVRSIESDFMLLFHRYWKALPPEEALAIVQEIVNTALKRPDQPIFLKHGKDVSITSRREETLFQVLHILRHLDAPLAESLIASHDQLAAAARRYPDGVESVRQETVEHWKAVGGMPSGISIPENPRHLKYQKLLTQASKDGNFAPVIELALERYREATAPDSPNHALKEFWPSTWCFRNILFRAGKLSGQSAAVYLDQIPDDDLRLFAQIELLTVLAGLPEFESVLWRSPNPPGLSCFLTVESYSG